MIHSHHNMHPTQINVSQPPPQMPQNMANPPNQQRMSHHHYQQRLSHQQIQQQIPPPIHGNRSSIAGLNHQVPPPVIPKQHLHQNIATLNQKPPQHVTNQQLSQNSQIQPTQRISYDKSFNQSSNLKRESNTKISVSATATLDPNNSSIVTGPPPSILQPPPATSLGHHHANILPKYQQHPPISTEANPVDCKTPVVSANKDILATSNVTVVLSSSSCDASAVEITEQGIESLANTKEKTPMCLVNELARFNKVQHQYRLISEQGPAHKKKFTVILKLGDEEYAAEGLSIKKAQHAAAKDAILKTAYKHPPLKANRQVKGAQICGKSNSGNITPTVELNALAMKRGEPTVYNVTSTTSGPHGMSSMASNSHYNGPSQFNQRGPNPYQPRRFLNQRGGGNFQNGRLPPHFTETFHVTLQVGNRTFSGMGPTQQAARHDAASRALEVLKPLTAEMDNVANKSITSASENDSENGDESLINSDIKSPISIVHEMALKRKLTVTFEVQSEKGPPHMKVYTTLCQVGNIVTEGEGNGKKLSKKKAAEKMMEELKKLPPLSPVEEPPNRLVTRIRRKQLQLQQQQNSPLVKKKSRNLIKEKAEAGSAVDELNPISQLIQIQQARKEKEPVYSVTDERGTARRREFIIEVSAGGFKASGSGPNKKVAKKIAAENLLIVMGISKSSETSSKEKLRAETEKAKKVQFIEPEVAKSPAVSSSGTSGRQIVPGLLLVSSTSEGFLTPSKPVAATAKTLSPAADEPAEKPSTSPSSTASNQDSGIGESGVSSRDQLNYLAQLFGFSVTYTDFPKGTHSDFLSLAALSTDPPNMCHGSGSSRDASREHAAAMALLAISEIGLDNVKPKAK